MSAKGTDVTFEIKRNAEQLTVIARGRLDAQTAPQLADEMREALDGVEEVVFDLSELEYISSAGMRVLLASYKLMRKREGAMRVENAQDDVMETLEMSGFASLFEMGR